MSVDAPDICTTQVYFSLDQSKRIEVLKKRNINDGNQSRAHDSSVDLFFITAVLDD